MLIGLIGWVLCGVLVGVAASKMVDLHGDDPRLGMGIGAIGGVVGGWAYSLISASPMNEVNFISLICAALTAVVPVVVWHLVRSRGKHDRPSIRRSY